MTSSQIAGRTRLLQSNQEPGTTSSGLRRCSAAGAPPLIRRDPIAGLTGDYLLDLLRNAPNDDLPLLKRVVRKTLIDSFCDNRIFGAKIRNISGNSFATDHNYRVNIGLSEGYAMFP